jgi:lipopolysaccharide/colanic/teichoic acid biosynthesis glycosyltransferase
VKRTFDVLIGALLLAFTAPLMAGVAAAVWGRMGAPVFFRQRRPGRGERPFTLLKFRTMREGDGPDAERLPPLGRFLRRTSLDELPALLNVLRGEMSLVGPRPLLMRYLPHYTPKERKRHHVRPGLTGWAQIHGRNDLPWGERLALDAWYAEHRTLGLDLRILARTVERVLFRKGARALPRRHLDDLDEVRAGKRDGADAEPTVSRRFPLS